MTGPYPMSYYVVGRDGKRRSIVHCGSTGGARARLVACPSALLSDPFGAGHGGLPLRAGRISSPVHLDRMTGWARPIGRAGRVPLP